MCKPRLCYLYLSFFPISALSVHPCALIRSLYDPPLAPPFFILIHPEEVKKKSKKLYLHLYFRPVLSFVNTSMCIVCFWLIVYHPCPGLWCHFTQIPRHRHRFISFSFPFLFVCECDVFDLLSAVCLPPSLHATKPSGTCDTIDRTEANCCLTFGKSRTSLSSPISLPSLPPRGDRRADMEIVPPLSVVFRS